MAAGASVGEPTFHLFHTKRRFPGQFLFLLITGIRMVQILLVPFVQHVFGTGHQMFVFGYINIVDEFHRTTTPGFFDDAIGTN